MRMRVTLAEVMAATMAVTGVSKAKLLEKNKHPPIVFARQAAMVVATRWTGRNISDVGRWMGQRNHATVLHAVKVVDREAKADINDEGSRPWLVDQIENHLGVGI
jgi:chromosomal replication initiator protein